MAVKTARCGPRASAASSTATSSCRRRPTPPSTRAATTSASRRDGSRSATTGEATSTPWPHACDDAHRPRRRLGAPVPPRRRRPGRRRRRARRRPGVNCHVDACMGGFTLPFMERPRPRRSTPWDFRVPGVTTMSADVHKYGYAPKGDLGDHAPRPRTAAAPSDVRLRRLARRLLRRPPASLGTKPGGPIAAGWAALHYLGVEGYVERSSGVPRSATRWSQGVSVRSTRLAVLGEPDATLWPSRPTRRARRRRPLRDRRRAHWPAAGTSTARAHPTSLHATVTPIHARDRSWTSSSPTCAPSSTTSAPPAPTTAPPTTPPSSNSELCGTSGVNWQPPTEDSPPGLPVDRALPVATCGSGRRRWTTNFTRGQLAEAHRAAGVELLGGDADLGAEAELLAVDEPGRGVDERRRRRRPRGRTGRRPRGRPVTIASLWPDP